MCIEQNTIFGPTIGVGRKGPFITGNEAISSALDSLSTIDFCLYRHFYADAYVLLRKVRDDLFQSLFLFTSLQDMNVFTDTKLTDKEESNIKKMNSKAFISSSIENIEKAKQYASEAWVNNELHNKEDFIYRTQFFDYDKYLRYLEETNEDIATVRKIFFNEKLENTSRKLNDYVHANGRQFVMNNYVSLNHSDCIKEFTNTLIDIFVIYVSFLTILDSTKLRSSDCLDILEMGGSLENDEQYWVAPCIEDFFSKYLNFSLRTFLQEHQKYGMKILPQ